MSDAAREQRRNAARKTTEILADDGEPIDPPESEILDEPIEVDPGLVERVKLMLTTGRIEHIADDSAELIAEIITLNKTQARKVRQEGGYAYTVKKTSSSGKTTTKLEANPRAVLLLKSLDIIGAVSPSPRRLPVLPPAAPPDEQWRQMEMFHDAGDGTPE